MSKKRRQYNAEYKFRVALAATKGRETVSQLASEHQIHPNQVRNWKRQLHEEGASVFTKNADRRQREQEAQEAEFYEQIGRGALRVQDGTRMVEKRLPDSIDVKRSLVETDDPAISIRRQCELLSLNRSTLYYQPAHESALNLRLMRLLDEQYMRTPFYGWPKMAALGKRLG